MNETSHNQLVKALREVLIDTSAESPLLIKRVPFICSDIKDIKLSMDAMSTKMESLTEIYVTKEAFYPVRIIAYGLIAICMTSLVGAIIYSIIK